MFRNSNFSSLNFSSSSASLILEAASSRTDAKNSVMAFSPSSESSLALFANGTPTSSLSAKPYYQGRQIVLEPDPPCSIGCVILITCTHRRVWYTPHSELVLALATERYGYHKTPGIRGSQNKLTTWTLWCVLVMRNIHPVLQGEPVWLRD